jgi:hypothetical protein
MHYASQLTPDFRVQARNRPSAVDRPCFKHRTDRGTATSTWVWPRAGGAATAGVVASVGRTRALVLHTPLALSPHVIPSFARLLRATAAVVGNEWQG